MSYDKTNITLMVISYEMTLIKRLILGSLSVFVKVTLLEMKMKLLKVHTISL